LKRKVKEISSRSFDLLEVLHSFEVCRVVVDLDCERAAYNGAKPQGFQIINRLHNTAGTRLLQLNGKLELSE
jgi:hypothetical protein